MLRTLVWFRRDLRLRDHAALAYACNSSESVVTAFVLSPTLLRDERCGAPLVQFFFSALRGLRERLRSFGSDLVLLEGDFADELDNLATQLNCNALAFNQDTDPAAIARDAIVSERFAARGIKVSSFVDQVAFGHDRITQASGKPYTVFTPYKKRWIETYTNSPLCAYPSERLLPGKLLPREELPPSHDIPTPETYGHTSSPHFPTGDEMSARNTLKDFLHQRIGRYQDQRNLPALDATSHLSPHLRAGTISVRTCISAAFAQHANADHATEQQIETWISEFIWRDFYHQILRNFPHTATGPFDPRGNAIRWLNDEADFTAWCQGRTGFPIVDAAMRQLNTTGWMHNRLRMIVASFLTKDLLVNWQYGERYFEQHLADADLAANNGGWQWSASTGTDAAPYFRVFNPTIQAKTYDPDGSFVRRMLPELGTSDYPAPIVDHAYARVRALEHYGAVFGKKVKS